MDFSVPDLLSTKISYGLVSLLLYSSDDAEARQVGYSLDKEGNTLFGFDEGDWQEGWYVIGVDLICFDPIFIDLNDIDFPVYTAMHGCGSWEESLVSASYDQFLLAIDALTKFTGKYSSADAVPDGAAKEFIEQLVAISGGKNPYYWGMFVRWEERELALKVTF